MSERIELKHDRTRESSKSKAELKSMTRGTHWTMHNVNGSELLEITSFSIALFRDYFILRPMQQITSIRRAGRLAYGAGFLVWSITSHLFPMALAAEAQHERIEHQRLTHYRNSAGEILPIKSMQDWLTRRAAIVEGMQEVMGPLPGREKRCALEMETVEETDCGSYVRRLITFSPEPKSRIPAYLLIPKAALSSGMKFPAVLCLHPTDDRIGHQVVVGLGGRPGRAYAKELAELGFVTIAPAYPRLANYQPDLKALGYQSGTMKAIWDNIRSLDLLESLPFVQAGRFGAIGHSLGGHNAIFTAVFDPRIQAIVSSCGFDSFLDYMNGNIKGWTSDRYMPRLLNYSRLEDIPFDFAELIGALAPRDVFVSAPFYDSNFKWRSVYRIEQEASRIYRLYGVGSRLQVEHPNCGHDFPDAMRQAAYKLFDATLRSQSSPP